MAEDELPLAETIVPSSAPSARAAPAAAMVRSFGDYELLGEIGRGGMGVVYQARDRHSGRLVALKMMLEEPGEGDTELRRFSLEARAAGQLNHSGIVAIHSCGEHEGHPFYTMDLIQGESLQKILEKGPLKPARAVRYLLGVARAVAAAHAVGIVHRDLKPSNVIIDENDQPRILDFGLAKRSRALLGRPMASESIAEVLPAETLDVPPMLTPIEGSRGSRSTREGTILGTPSYMSPEQARGQHEKVGPPADVHALGVLFYEMLVGRPPFQGGDVVSTLMQVVEREPPRMWVEGRRVPRVLESVCRRCLKKDPKERYSDAGALADSLDWQWDRMRQRRRHIFGFMLGVFGAALLILIRVLLADDLARSNKTLSQWAAAGGSSEEAAASALAWLFDAAVFVGGTLLALLSAGFAAIGWLRCLAFRPQASDAEAAAVKTEPFLQRLFAAGRTRRGETETESAGLADVELLKLLYGWEGGQLHRGRQKSLDRPVLVWHESRPRTEDERGPGISVRHPYVLGLHGVVSGPEGRLLITEPAAARNLADLLQRDNLQPRDAVLLAGRIARALQAFHDLGSCHGRLSPEWILVRGDLEPLLCPCGVPSTSADDRRRDCVALAEMLRSWLPPRPQRGPWQPLAAVYQVCAAATAGEYAHAGPLADDLDRALQLALIRARQRWATLAAIILAVLPFLVLVGEWVMGGSRTGRSPEDRLITDHLFLVLAPAAAVLGFLHGRALIQRYRLVLRNARYRLSFTASTLLGLVQFGLLALQAVLLCPPHGGWPAAVLVLGYWLLGTYLTVLVGAAEALLRRTMVAE